MKGLPAQPVEPAESTEEAVRSPSANEADEATEPALSPSTHALPEPAQQVSPATPRLAEASAQTNADVLSDDKGEFDVDDSMEELDLHLFFQSQAEAEKMHTPEVSWARFYCRSCVTLRLLPPCYVKMISMLAQVGSAMSRMNEALRQHWQKRPRCPGLRAPPSKAI